MRKFNLGRQRQKQSQIRRVRVRGRVRDEYVYPYLRLTCAKLQEEGEIGNGIGSGRVGTGEERESARQ